MGIGSLPQNTFHKLFMDTNITTTSQTIEAKKEWLKQIQQAREQYEDPKGPVDAFSVAGPLCTWIGISN